MIYMIPLHRKAQHDKPTAVTVCLSSPCMCEWCWGERRRRVDGDDPLALNLQLHRVQHYGHGWTGLSDAELMKIRQLFIH